MSQQPEANERSDPRDRNLAWSQERRPSLGPAIVSGSCAVAVALISGAFNWINRPPMPSTPPTLAVDRQSREASPDRTAELSVEAENLPAMFRNSEPMYAVDFEAFQAVVRDTTLDPQVRQNVIDKVVGNAVLWQGYVARVSENDPTETGLVATLVIVEEPKLATHVLMDHAAICRFVSDPAGDLAQLKPGTRVTVRGDCVGHTPLGTEIKNCHLVDVFTAGHKSGTVVR